MYNKTPKPIYLEVGQCYSIDGKNFLIEERTYNKIFGYLVDENKEPYGRKRILGTKGKSIVKL